MLVGMVCYTMGEWYGNYGLMKSVIGRGHRITVQLSARRNYIHIFVTAWL